MKKKILLMDMFSTIHVGNGALLDNTIKLCEKACDQCEFHIITLDKETNKLKYDSDKLYNPMFGGFWFGLSRIGKLGWALKQIMFIFLQIINEYSFKMSSKNLTFTDDQKQVIDAIEESDICVSSSGEMISDTFYQMLPFWLFTYWLAMKKNKKFIFFPQSIGPLEKKWTRFLVKLVLKNAHLIAGRDQLSYDTLISLGINKSKIMFVPDVAIQQDIGKANIDLYFKEKTKKIIGITISNPPHSEMGRSIDFIEEIGNKIENLNSEHYKVLIMPSNYKLHEISADYKLCLKLETRLSKKFETAILENRPYSSDEYIALLERLEFFISTRMHVAILATTVAIPTIAINTQHKIKAYMQNINMQHFCVEYSDMDQISNLIQKIEKEREIIVFDLKAANERLKKQQLPFINKLKQIIQN